MKLFDRTVTHPSDNVSLEDEVDDGDGDNPYHIGCKTWSIVIEILSCVVELEERQGPHFGILVQDEEWQHEVIPEPECIDDHGCSVHGF